MLKMSVHFRDNVMNLLSLLCACQEFLGDTRKYYDAELETVDFGKNYEAARLNINGWVEKQTQGDYDVAVFTVLYQKASYHEKGWV